MCAVAERVFCQFRVAPDHFQPSFSLPGGAPRPLGVTKPAMRQLSLDEAPLICEGLGPCQMTALPPAQGHTPIRAILGE